MKHLCATAILTICTWLGAPEVGHASPPRLRMASEQGNYGVGTRTFTNVPMTNGRLTTIRVFYPTDAGTSCEPSSYPVTFVPPPFLAGKVVGAFTVSSPLCAVLDAAPARDEQGAPIAFPLFIYDHGGGAGQDFHLISQLPLHERLASHGFVVAIAKHAAAADVKVRDLQRVLDFLVSDDDPLRSSIDPARIGVGGTSAGGGAALGLAGGVAASGLAPDPRVRAVVVSEPARSSVNATLEDVARISVPLLLMNGSQMADPEINAAAMQELFDLTTSALPRAHVFTENAAHMSYVTGLCGSIMDARDQAIAAGAGADLLTNPASTTTSAAAEYAWFMWNIGATPAGGLGFGGGRNICAAEELAPYFVPGDQDAALGDPGQPVPSDRAMVPVVNHYTVAFLKVFLEGDPRYMAALAPGQARNVGPAQVTIVE